MAPHALRLSVVVPTHDTRALTLRCLETVAATGPDELIVVDDGSTDGTAQAVAAAHPRARLVRSERARGFSAAANEGVQAASGDVLWLVNSDTEVPAEAAAFLRAAFEQWPRLAAASPQLVNPDGSSQWTAGRFPTLSWLMALGSGLPAWLGRRRPCASDPHAPPRCVDWVSGAALALRRAAWDETGAFDEGFRFYGQDLDWCWRLERVKWDVMLLPGLRVKHQGGATIQKRGRAVGTQQLELLFTDLVRCVERRQGHAAARRAAFALRAGATLRLGARAARRAFASGAEREAMARESAALRAAVRAL